MARWVRAGLNLNLPMLGDTGISGFRHHPLPRRRARRARTARPYGPSALQSSGFCERPIAVCVHSSRSLARPRIRGRLWTRSNGSWRADEPEGKSRRPARLMPQDLSCYTDAFIGARRRLITMDIAISDFGPTATRVVLVGKLDIAGADKIDLPLATLAGTRRSAVIDMAGVVSSPRSASGISYSPRRRSRARMASFCCSIPTPWSPKLSRPRTWTSSCRSYAARTRLVRRSPDCDR